MTTWQFFDRFPPILVRLLAKKGKRLPLSSTDIEVASGLSHFEVEAISWSTSWAGIDIPKARAFLKACKIDPTNPQQMKVVTVYLAGRTTTEGVRIPPTWDYLKRSALWRSYYGPMYRHFYQSRMQAMNPPKPQP